MTAGLMILWSGLLLVLPGEDEAKQLFTDGCAFYERGNYETALNAFDQGLQQGENMGLFHLNAGCCLAKLDRKGEALHRLLSARHYRPRDPKVLINIRIVREMLGLPKDRVKEGFLRELMETIGTFTQTEYQVAAALAACPAFLLGAFYFLTDKRILKWLAATFVVPSILFLCLGLALAAGIGGRGGVAVRACEVMDKPDLREGRTVYTLREGEEVRLMEGRAGWFQVEDVRGRIGWTLLGDVQRF